MLLDTSFVSRPAGTARAGAFSLSLAVHAGLLAGALLLSMASAGELPQIARDRGRELVVALPPALPPAAAMLPPRAGGSAPMRTRSIERAPAMRATTPVLPVAAALPRAADDEGATCRGCAFGITDAGSPPGAPDGVMAGGRGGPAAAPIRIGHRGVVPPVKIRHLDPVYPELVKRTGIQDTVVVDCVIDEHGAVVQTRVLRGHPLLVDPTAAAIRQWRYRPTLLDGVPVAVAMTITVHFRLR